MEIRYLEQNEKEKSRDLWKTCFPEDSARFLDYYYEERCRDNEILVIEENVEASDEALPPADVRITSMLQRNPYRVQTEKAVYPLDYIVAVATAPERRHRGYMRMLLSRMMKDQNEARMPFTFLMPADPEIYRPFGFEYVYDQPHWKLTEEGQKRLRRVPAAGEAEAAEAGVWLNRWLERRYRIFARRDEAYMTRLWKEIRSEYGDWELLFDGSRMVGMECFWGKDTKERRFLYAEDAFLEEEKAASPAIMARIINLKEFMSGIRLEEADAAAVGNAAAFGNTADENALAGNAAKDAVTENPSLENGEQIQGLRIILGIRDNQLEENDGLFSWELSEEGSSVIEKLSDEVPEDIWKIPVETLTQWLMGYRTAEEVVKKMTEAGAGGWKVAAPGQKELQMACGAGLLKELERIRTMTGIFLDEVV